MLQHLIVDSKSIYLISLALAGGTVRWYQYDPGSSSWSASNNGSTITPGSQSVGKDWAHYAHVFSAGTGIIGAVQMHSNLDPQQGLATGDLVWFRDTVGNGTSSWANNGAPTRWNQAVGWEHFLQLTSWGDDNGAVLLGIHEIGKIFKYRIVVTNGVPSFTEAGLVSGTEWVTEFRKIVYGGVDSTGAHIVYAVDAEGHLCFGKYPAAQTQWARPVAISGTSGFERYLHLLYRASTTTTTTTQHHLYGVKADDGHLYLFKDTGRDGSADSITSSNSGSPIGTDWIVGSYAKPSMDSTHGYCWPLSTHQGGPPIEFMLSTPSSQQVTVTYVRLDGNTDPVRGTAVTGVAPFSVQASRRQAPPDAYQRGCRWPASFTLTTASLNWPSGVYAARYTVGENDYYIPFVLKPAAVQADVKIAVLANSNTWNAYNTWGGMSVYDRRYARLSFQRPNPGALTECHVLRGELFLHKWLQSTYPNRFAVYTDLDLDAMTPEQIAHYDAWILPEHPEYWSVRMFQQIRQYADNGGNILYLGGNGLYRMALYDDSGSRQTAQYLHPFLSATPGTATTTRVAPASSDRGWEFCDMNFPGGPSAQIREISLLGIAWNGATADGGAYKVALTESTPRLFPTATAVDTVMGGTGRYLANDARLAAAGGERDDSYQGDKPDGLQILANGVNSDGSAQASASHMTCYYRKPSGATHRKGLVFSVGSLSFIGSLLIDEKLQALVKNVLAECGVT